MLENGNQSNINSDLIAEPGLASGLDVELHEEDKITYPLTSKREEKLLPKKKLIKHKKNG